MSLERLPANLTGLALAVQRADSHDVVMTQRLGFRFLLLPLFGTFAVAGCASSAPSEPASEPVSAYSEACESAFRAAIDEAETGGATETAYVETLSACVEDEWIAAMRDMPGAAGFTSSTEEQATQSLDILCGGYPTVGLCATRA